MAFAVSNGIDGQSWLARPNASLSRRGRRLLVCLIGLVSLGVALAFAVVGAWPVLPFAGLEIAGLWLAVRYFERHESDYESVQLESDRLSIEVRDGPHCRREDCAACWMRFFLCRPERAGALRLRFRAYGRHIDVGRWMSEDEIVALSAALRQAIGRRGGYEMPLSKEGR